MDQNINLTPEPNTEPNTEPDTTVPVGGAEASAATAIPKARMSVEEMRDLAQRCAVAKRRDLFADMVLRDLTLAEAGRELINRIADEAGPEIQSQVLAHVGTSPEVKGDKTLVESMKRRLGLTTKHKEN